MLVVHGRWDRDLLLWAEDPVAPPVARTRGSARRGRAVGRHPFAVPVARLMAALAGSGLAATDGLGVDDGDAVMDLPTLGGVPLRSPDLPEPGWPDDRDWPDDREREATPADAPELVSWRVPVARIAPGGALTLLLALGRDGCERAATQGADPGGTADSVLPGGDLRHLARIAATADDLTRRGRVLPWVHSDPQRARACWLPVVTGQDARQVRDLALALPPVARALSVPAPDTVAQALDALTDAAVRRRWGRTGVRPPIRRPGAASRSQRGRDVVADWRAALIGDDPEFRVAAGEAERLADLLADWQSDAVGGPVRALFRLVEPEPKAEPEPGVDAASDLWAVEFGLQAADEPSLVVDAERVWRSKRRMVALARHVADPQETLLAELGRALRLVPDLEPALRTARPTRLELDTAGAHEFLRTGAPSLAAAGFGVLLPAWWGRPGARIGVRARASTPSQPGAATGRPAFGQEALVEFRWEVALGEDILTEAELAALADLQQPLVRVRGQWVELDSARLRNGLKLVRENGSGRLTIGEMLQVVGSGDGGPGGLPVVGVEADGWLGDLLAGAAEVRVNPVPVPDTFTGTLRPYQERGLAWLTFLQRLGVGAILADDMGLGKTVQLLALLAADLAGRASGDDGWGPTLLVCPMSLVGNWQREAGRFTPGLRVHVHHGAERPRGKAFREAVASSDLVVTTYSLAARDAAALAGVGWRRVVLDEAQAVKNAATKAAIAVRGLPAGHRIAVTGTPVENRLADLWSLMEFANPGLLGNPSRFKQRFAVPIERHADADATARLRAITQPFILRRVKTDRQIIADLPEKLEMEVVCGLTREQASLYQAVVDDMLRRVADSDGMERRGLVLATMTKLKQVCNHPAQFLRDGSRLAGRSGKLDRLEEILEEVLAVGEKALLFTQFAEFGALLRRAPVRPVRSRGAVPARRGVQSGTRPDGGPLPVRRGRRLRDLRAVPQGRRDRAHPDPGQPRDPRRPVVEPRGRGPGHRPGVPDRADPQRPGSQVGLRRHAGGTDRGDDPGQARSGVVRRGDRRGLADRAEHRSAAGADQARRRRRGGVRETQPMPFYPPSRPRPVEGGLTARSTRGAIGATWWSQRFIGVLEGFALGSRLTRGRAYARRGQVISLAVAPGEVSARVQGSRATPYRVTIGLAPFSAEVWATIDTALAEQAIHSAGLLAGHLPPELETVFHDVGARLFPDAIGELRLSCSCPDREVPCKHIAASFYLLAERFDDDPFEILHWRGRARDVLLARVRELRSSGEHSDPADPDPTADAPHPAGRGVAGARTALADLPDTAPSPALFWTSPVSMPPATAVVDTPVDLLLRQLSEPPAALGGEELRTLLRRVYEALPDPDEPPPQAAPRR